MDQHSLKLLEFERITAAIAERAASVRGQAALRAWRPLSERAAREREQNRLSQALRRAAEPGEWCFTGPGELHALTAVASEHGLDGPALVEVKRWLEAGDATLQAWSDDETRERHPALVEIADRAAPPAGLLARLARALDDDGSVRDAASPALARARRELREGERRLEQQLERWVRPFGPEAHVTRHGDRFVALVPAAGFSRRRGIVHDVSGSARSLYVEPLEACGDNNHLLELRAAAAEEERRILNELSQAVFETRSELEELEEALVLLDTLRARARWALDLGAVAIAPGGARLRLVRARHPLLAIAERGEGPARAVVPLDLELGSPGRLLLVSGPNMGGKTVLLKTVGLAVLMAHAGLPVLAAEGSAVPEIEAVVVDLGDEQSVDQGLSTFAAHLKVLAQMAEVAGGRTLVLCDELGAGTDPEEGAALGRALIEHFAARGTWGIVTTHLGSLKRLAGEVAGVVNGSLEFDAQTLTSRYRFLPGVPGASHALSVAERLGFPAPLLERARRLTPEQARALERLTEELGAAHRELQAGREALAHAEREARVAAEGHRQTEAEIRREWTERRRETAREGEALLARARGLWQSLDRESRKRELGRDQLRPMKQELRRLEGDLAPLAGPPAEVEPLPPEHLTAGQRVRVVDLGVDAEVVNGPDAEGRVELRRGSWTIQSHASKLAAAEPRGGASEPGVRGTWSLPEQAPSLEVDVRGMEVDEALSTLDGGLDRALVGGLTELRIIHGVGRGILRAAVERHLRGHPQVAEQRLGQVGEGGRGVTIARLR
ncbi:MAG TPA: Smr/MutS family protein [Candidatus Limnocylindria bacterium]|nr:Smr/MutS family protein [Candidatus Limnocylindria bacterium]